MIQMITANPEAAFALIGTLSGALIGGFFGHQEARMKYHSEFVARQYERVNERVIINGVEVLINWLESALGFCTNPIQDTDAARDFMAAGIPMRAALVLDGRFSTKWRLALEEMYALSCEAISSGKAVEELPEQYDKIVAELEWYADMQLSFPTAGWWRRSLLWKVRYWFTGPQ